MFFILNLFFNNNRVFIYFDFNNVTKLCEKEREREKKTN